MTLFQGLCGRLLCLACLTVFFLPGCMRYKNETRYLELKESAEPIEFLRTPDSCFEDLPGYDFEPHYFTFHGLRVHYIDEGPPDAPPVLLLHGEPEWSYIYRKMIPPISDAGCRVIAPDLIGFGRSDKPVKLKDLSYAMQVDMIAALLEELDLDRITLFCQDWGGLIGLMAAAENEERFERIVAANTFFPGFPEDRLSEKTRKKVTEMSRGWIAFAAWLAWSQTAVDMPVGLVMQMGTVSKLPKEVVAAYNAPFPNYRYKAAPRVYPSLTGTQLERNERAWQVFLRWEKPFLTAFSDKDPMMYGAEAIYQELIPGAKGQPHTTIRGASHFLQEEKGEELAEVILDFIALTE